MKCKCCCNKKREQTESKTAENEQVEQLENLSDIPQKEQPTKKKNFFVRHKILVILISVILAIGLAIGIAAIVDGVNGIKVLGDFITDQILGMKWLNMLLGMAFTGMFGEEFMSTRWGGAIQFFIYDTIKIMVLLCLLIFLISQSHKDRYGRTRAKRRNSTEQRPDSVLSKAVKPKLLFWFIFIVVIGIIAIGYILNALNFLFV